MVRTMRSLCLVMLGLFFPALILGQGVQHANFAWALGVNNAIIALPGASITVCSGTTLPTPGVACSPTTTIFSSVTLTTTAVNPVTADLAGNFTFWAAPGNNYIVSVSALGYMTYSYSWTATLTTGGSYGFTGNLTFGGTSIFNGPTSFFGGLTANSIADTGLTPGNCVQATGGGVLVTTVGPCGVSSGFLTATGTPSSGQLAKFTGASSITGIPGITENGALTILEQLNLSSLFGTTLLVDCNNTQSWAGGDFGAWVNSAQTALPTLGGLKTGAILLGACGTTVTQSTAITVTSPSISIIGPGSNSLIISCTVTTDCWNIRTNPFGVTIAGKFGGFTLIGQGSSNANAVGIHTGDMVGAEFNDIQIDNFLGTNSSCFWMDNQSGWFERNTITRLETGIHQATQTGCKKNVRATVNGGTISFARTRFINSNISVAAGNTGISVEGGVFWYQGTLEFGGNMIGNGGTVLALSGSANLFDDRMDIGVECTNTCTSATLINASGTSTMSLAFGRITGGSGFTNSITTTNPLHMNYGTFNNSPADRLNQEAIGFFNNEGGTFGEWIIPVLGAPSFFGGFTDNLGFNGTNFTTATDLTNNGASAVAGGHNGIMSFYTVPTNTPASGQTIAQGSLSSFVRATLQASGFSINPPLYLVEQTNSSCILGSDAIWGDSTYHGFKGCTNGSNIHKLALTDSGSCSMAAGTTCTFSLGATFNTTPLTYASIDAASAPPATAINAKCSLSGTTVTVTAGASNSLTWDCLLVGNPN